MNITVEVEEKNKEITIPTAFGEIKINAKRVAVVKSDNHPIFSVFYTENGDFIVSIPPSVVKISDPINFSEIFNQKHYGDLSQHLKKAIIPAMALAAGYDDVNKFLDDYIKIEVENYIGKDHPDEIFSDSIIVKAFLGEHGIITSWKKIETPTVPTIARILIPVNMTTAGEKEFLEKTLDDIKLLPYAEWDKITEYAIEYVKYIIRKNLQEKGLL